MVVIQVEITNFGGQWYIFRQVNKLAHFLTLDLAVALLVIYIIIDIYGRMTQHNLVTMGQVISMVMLIHLVPLRGMQIVI